MTLVCQHLRWIARPLLLGLGLAVVANAWADDYPTPRPLRRPAAVATSASHEQPVPDQPAFAQPVHEASTLSTAVDVESQAGSNDAVSMAGYPTPRPIGSRRPALRLVSNPQPRDTTASPSDVREGLRLALQPDEPNPPAAPIDDPNKLPPARPLSPFIDDPLEIYCPSDADKERWFKPFKDIVAVSYPREGSLPIDCSVDLFTSARRADAQLPWPQYEYNWVAPEYWHHPIYFDDVPLERYGQSLWPAGQSWLSGLKFFGSVPIMIPKLWADRPFSYISSLGKFRPGSPIPAFKQRARFPYDEGYYYGLGKGGWLPGRIAYPGPTIYDEPILSPIQGE